MKSSSIKIVVGSIIIFLIIAVVFLNEKPATDIITASQPHFSGKKKSLIVNGKKYDGPEKFAYYQSAIRAGQIDLEAPLIYPQYQPFNKAKELNNALKKNSLKARNEATADFKERGPSNVPGRTRTILIDPDDATQNTWFAGNVSGGIWKTTDAGANWIEIAPDLNNMAIVTLAMSEANSSVIYAGTGEGWMGGLTLLNGNGIYKSTDKGSTWQLLPSTENTDFINVSRIIVDPSDENIVLATTASRKAFAGGITAQSGGIMRSTDGGISWTSVFESSAPVQQIIAAPSNFNIQYATVGDGNGVYKSTNKGLTWTNKNNGLLLDGRIEVGVSHSDPNKVYGSAEGRISGSGSDLYVTTNGGDDWSFVNVDFDNEPLPFLGGQGWYDNSVMVHPFDDNKVYLGGIGMFMVDVNFNDAQSTQAYAINLDDVDTFISLINFSAGAAGGTLEVGAAANETKVEIRFGADKTQKAHRFLVPEGEGSGVPDADYSFADYVDVPFEVWDVTNNRQLMVSFRDQQRNGTFELLESNTDGDPSTHAREYLYISNVDYDGTSANADISTNGGHVFESMYFIWPVLSTGATWNPGSFANSNLIISFDSFSSVGSSLLVVSDVYEEYDGKNVFSFTEESGLHPDQHWIVPIITDNAANLFKVLNGNDGGIYVSKEGTDPGTVEGDWIMAGNKYNTTQFYGADKVAGTEQYWGGAQDNGTWLSPANEVAASESPYTIILGGDGFEVINHYTDPLKMIGGSQFNGFVATENGWENGQGYLADLGLGDNGPFISRLSNAYQDPDVLYTVEETGVYKSSNFGRSWKEIAITDGWNFWDGIDVEVSKANPRIVWAGGSMSANGNLFVSVDAGESFEAVPNFGDIGLCTGLYSHPTKDSTAFAVFSVSESPKVLRTDDLGQNWTDISGFSAGSISTGFPNVATFALQAMPYDDNVLWAGTEIGLFETLDGGATWSIVDEFPSVTIWDFKIKDGQVIIATHGRGIWTADILELADFTAPNVAFSPELVSIGKSYTDLGISLSVNLRSLYDSIYVTSNDIVVIESVGNEALEVQDYSFNVNTVGTYKVRVSAFKDGIPYFTVPTTLDITEPLAAVNSYYTDFEDNTLDTDFELDRWTIDTTSGTGFSRSLSTEHPYPEADGLGLSSINLIANLRVPIIVSDAPSIIRFNEIVLVEEGENGTSFGDAEFWDFVIVEASSNGANWVPLINGYDSDDNPDWDGSATSATSSLYRTRAIDISDTFSPGEIIGIRFRLFSDPFANGWGWGIDELEIQMEDADGDGFSFISDCDDANPDFNPGAIDIPDNDIDENCDGENLITATEVAAESSIRIFPIPTNSNLNVTINNSFKGNVLIQIISISGQVMLEESFQLNDGHLSRDVNVSNLQSGLYLLKISDENSSLTRRVIIE